MLDARELFTVRSISRGQIAESISSVTVQPVDKRLLKHAFCRQYAKELGQLEDSAISFECNEDDYEVAETDLNARFAKLLGVAVDSLLWRK